MHARTRAKTHITTSATIQSGAWTRITASFDEEVLKVWFDGTLVGSETWPIARNYGNCTAVIGSSSAGFAGQMDNLLLMGAPLEPTSVNDLIANGRDVAANGLLATYTPETVLSYGSQDQPAVSTVTISSEGKGLRLTGNAWKRVPIQYTVTPNTMLAVTIDITDPGEITGVGVDVASVSVDSFQVAGTQSWIGIFDGPDVQTGAPQTILIPIGSYYTGTANNLHFILDDDADASADVTFRNLRLFEQAP